MYFTLFHQEFSIADKLNIIGNGVVIDPAVFKVRSRTWALPVSELATRL